MSIAIPDQSIQLRSTVQTGGQLEITLDMVETPTPGPAKFLSAWRPRQSTPPTSACSSEWPT